MSNCSVIVAWVVIRLRRTPFVLIALTCPLAALRLLILWARHIPMDHDTFQYLHLQYVFFNEAAQHGRLPLWLPFLTHGAPSNFWIVISQGVLATALSAVPSLLRHVRFLPYFEAGLLLDEFVLLLGCLLLARRCYRSPVPAMFVAVSVVYTTVVSRQPWYNFHLFYFLPLVLYCLDRAARESSPRHLGLAVLFGAGTVIGNLPYFIPLTVFTIVVFEVSAAVFGHHDLLVGLRKLRDTASWPRVAALLIPLALACAVAVYVRDGFAHTVFSGDRSAHGRVALSNFLEYGWDTGFAKFDDLLGRYPSGLNNRDNTLYGGILLVPFSLVALARVRSGMAYAFGATAAILALFTAGTFVSEAFYYGVPLGQYYRDIGHAATLVKLFLVFFAGFGVEEFWNVVARARRVPWPRQPWGDRAVIFIPLGALVLALPVLIAQRMLPVPTYRFPDVWSFGYTALLATAMIVLFLLMLWRHSWAYALAVAALAVHGADTVWFKVEMEYARVPSVSAAVTHLFEPAPYRFPMERTQVYATNRRFAALAPVILENGVLPGGGSQPYFYEYRFHGGSLYWTTELLLFLDAGASPFRTDFWQDGIDAFYRAWVPPSKDVHEHLGFPIPAARAYRKLSGVGFPKLQLFRGIRVLPNARLVAKALATPSFAGDHLLIAEADVPERGLPLVVSRSATDALSANDRLAGGLVAVRAFTFDTLRLSVANNSRAPAVLYYADAWDPRWRVFVNGVASPVIRTNLGFKSVVVPPGDSDVQFLFGDVRSRILSEASVLLSLFVVASVALLVHLDLRTS